MRFRASVLSLGSLLAMLLLGRLGAAAEMEAQMRLQPGDTAPDFTLTDIDGQAHQLSELTGAGRIVVLEWYSPECPISTAYYTPSDSHELGCLPGSHAALAGADLVWLAINSVSPDAEGNSLQDNLRLRDEAKVPYPMLLDGDSAVASAYGARKTPDIFIIDAQGKLAYCGAVDEGDFRDYPRGRNYIVEAVTALRAGRAPEVSATEPFGCAL
jgi:peroxiredoxin